MKFTIGADPEFFLRSSRDNSIKSAIGTLGGTKDDPTPLPIGEGFAVQEDNVALEFNIPPSESSDALVNNLNAAVGFLSSQLAEQFNLTITNESALIFPQEELMDIRALVFGCDPDYNAWTGDVNPRPSAANPFLRSAGGHVHVGLAEKLSRKDKYRLGRLMDLHLGIPSVTMDDGVMRKELYGKAGAMRLKPYGMEYRTLSNFWVFSPTLNKWVWDATERAVDDFCGGRDIPELEELVVNTINSNNTRVAAQMIADYGLVHVQ
jgi:hypothetical protein